MADDHVFKPVAWRQRVAGRSHFAGQISRSDRDTRLRIGNVVLEFFRPVHGIDGHHHCIRTQDGKVRNHQLRAVLHAQRDAISALHTQRLQLRRQSLRRIGQLPVGGCGAKEHQSGFIGVARGVDLQVVPQRGARHGDGMRQPWGPERVVGLH